MEHVRGRRAAETVTEACSTQNVPIAIQNCVARTQEEMAELIVTTEIPFAAALTAVKGLLAPAEEHLGDTFGLIVSHDRACVFDPHRHYDRDVDPIPENAKGMLIMSMPTANGQCILPLCEWIFRQLLPSMNASPTQLDIAIARRRPMMDHSPLPQEAELPAQPVLVDDGSQESDSEDSDASLYGASSLDLASDDEGIREPMSVKVQFALVASQIIDCWTPRLFVMMTLQF